MTILGRLGGGAAALLFMVPALAATKETASAATDSGTLGLGGLLQVALALAIVLGVIVALAWLLRRVGGVQYGGAGLVRVLGGVAVGQRERILLVQVGETQLLVGVAPGRVNRLHVLEETVEGPKPGTGVESFASRFAAALKRQGPAQ